MLKLQKTALKFLLLGLALGVLTAPRSGMATRRMFVDQIGETLHLRRK